MTRDFVSALRRARGPVRLSGMNRVGIVLCLLLATACGKADGRNGVVQPSENVDRAALSAAIDGLRVATGGDTMLTVGTCDRGTNYCVKLSTVESIRFEGKECAGWTDEPHERGAETIIDLQLGNTPMTIAHELLHAIGIMEHAGGPDRHELLFEENDLGTARVFGPLTAELYRAEFGVWTREDTVIAPIIQTDTEPQTPEEPAVTED